MFWETGRMKSSRLPDRNVVLMGVGHTNAHIVRMWRMNPIDNASLTCISDRPVATYSGMLPAVLAGLVPRSQMEIDLVRLCASVGARLIVDKVTAIDRENGLLRFSDRPAVRYDALSIGIGSVPASGNLTTDAAGDAALIKIKPMQTFLQRLEDRVADIRRAGQPIKAIVVGSGVAGIEILFCLRGFFKSQGCTDVEIELVTRSEEILDGSTAGARTRVTKEIEKRGHHLRLQHEVTRIEAVDSSPVLCRVQCGDGTTLESNLIVWATGATGPPGVDGLDLPINERGFVRVDSTLRTTDRDRYPNHPVFVVGDTGTIQNEQLPKAGVYAVRQGPILWDNLQRSFGEDDLKVYRPQRSFLRLINLGDGRAIGEWKGLSFSGRWAYHLKDYIDSSFMEKYDPVAMPEDTSQPMQCHGCGCKLEPQILNAALRLEKNDSVSRSAATIELEDAAQIGGKHASGLMASTDFFTNPFDDPYLFGRIAAVHAASDLLASGAKPTESLANVVVPEGGRKSQQSWLSDFLAGARREFERYDARIVGGHTIVGPRSEAGFTVIGHALTQNGLKKSALRPGDRLYLTKPLGIGVLLAAHMRAKCPGREFLQLVDLMLSPQEGYSRIACDIGLQAATDITGFGLFGHLLEMLEASRVKAIIECDNVPVLSAALELTAQGVESSLLAGNLSLSNRVAASDRLKQSDRYRLLFDPQTCGGLLFGVPESLECEWLRQLQESDFVMPTRIGRVLPEVPNAEVPLIQIIESERDATQT